MFTFKQKIFITYAFVFFIFIALIYPFAQSTVTDILRKGMEDRASELIEILKKAPNDEALISMTKEQKPVIFFRVSIINHNRKLLYDSHTKRVLGPRFSQEYIVTAPEVLRAFREGTGYHEEYSEILNQDFAYFAKTFAFHGKKYVLRTAFPLKFIEEISGDFEMGILGFAIGILLLFSLLTWFIINNLTRPIQKIIDAVRPYQEGKTDVIPQVEIQNRNPSDELGQLGKTLNSLSLKVQNHIKTLTEERNEKKEVLESLMEGVVAINNEKTITFINTTALSLLELEENAVTGESLEALKSTDATDLIEKCLEEQEVCQETIEIEIKGETSYLEFVAIPKEDQTGVILVLRDKTGQVRINRMRTDFIANASHELKTPITIIRGFAETLHDNPDLPPDTYKQVTAKIVNNCEKMTNLIKDLLTITDIEHIPESRLVDCNIKELADNARISVADAYTDAEITLHYEEEEDYHLLCDPNLIELCLTNLVENAAKYSPPPAKITITLNRTEEWIAVAIKDNGIGIPKEDQKNIFQRFFRSHRSMYVPKIKGSGLGLSIVETIISKHFGKITLDSEENKGSTFTVFLPIRNRESI